MLALSLSLAVCAHRRCHQKISIILSAVTFCKIYNRRRVQTRARKSELQMITRKAIKLLQQYLTHRGSFPCRSGRIDRNRLSSHERQDGRRSAITTNTHPINFAACPAKNKSKLFVRCRDWLFAPELLLRCYRSIPSIP